MRKIIIYLLLFVACLSLTAPLTVHAQQSIINSEEEINFTVYSTDGAFLFERAGVKVGDEYLSKDFKKYEVISINYESGVGIAKFKQQVKKPETNISVIPKKIATKRKTFGLYMTHNAESFVVGDGTDSIYGAGGIHDVAKALKLECEKLGINSILDETLHLPHNSGAYSRSSLTAKKLLNQHSNIDALFDVHRDGSSRASYIARVNGYDRCMIRLVVGKANPNFKANEQFAIYIMSVANELYPWLIKDIYYATGHYNQALFNKSILLEMGCHLVEKHLVLNSVAPLADVLNTTLYHTTVNKNTGELIINGDENEDEPIVNEAIGNEKEEGLQLGNVINLFIIIGSVIFIIAFILMLNKGLSGKNSKNKKPNKKQ